MDGGGGGALALMVVDMAVSEMRQQAMVTRAWLEASGEDERASLLFRRLSPLLLLKLLPNHFFSAPPLPSPPPPLFAELSQHLLLRMAGGEDNPLE